jgi:hypothetical protein
MSRWEWYFLTQRKHLFYAISNFADFRTWPYTVANDTTLLCTFVVHSGNDECFGRKKAEMYTVKGLFQNGVATPEESVSGREGQQVLITFLDDEELETLPVLELEEVVAQIEALGPNRETYTPPTQSLARLLADAPNEPSIDADAWNRQWAAVEAAMKQRDLADDRAEGRG